MIYPETINNLIECYKKLPGIGEKRAQDIIKQRETMVGFKVVTDLQEVNGIGAKTFAKLEPLVTV